MSTYTKEQFLNDVKAEAVALRQHATKEELGKLDIRLLEPSYKTRCVYGLMTGNCNSARALELIQKCCKRFFHNDDYVMIRNYEEALKIVNGETCDLSNRGATIDYFSSIETYIFLREKNANLISYLRGETDDLNL